MANPEQLAILKSGVEAWNKWRQENPEVRPDLSGADFIEANLRNAKLSAANLNRANLSRADLSGASLFVAKLREADLSEANLRGVSLFGADLSGANLSNATLIDANLSRANLNKTNLRGVDLSGKDLSNANLSGANLTETNLSNANLSGADLVDANLDRANLKGATLSGAYLYKAIIANAIFDEPIFDEAIFDKPILAGESASIVKESRQDEVERYPDITLPSKMELGKVYSVRIALTVTPIGIGAAKQFFQIIMSRDKASAELDVLVTADDFEIVDGNYYNMLVPRKGNSNPLLVKMIPRSLGEKQMKIEFFQNSRYIGGIVSKTNVVRSGDDDIVGNIEFGGKITINSKAPAPDLIVLITESRTANDHLRYTFKLHSPKFGLYFHTIKEELTFSGSPSKWISALFNELIKLPVESSDAEEVRETLNTIGADLYEKLFPRELKDLWGKFIRRRVKSVMIISDEPWIPWEIIRPSYEDKSGQIKEDGFLCEDYWLTRWLAGPTPPSKITIKQGALISPSATSLPSSQLESDFLMGLGMITTVEPNLAAVRKLLSAGGYELLHFACHGSFDPESNEQSIIYLHGRDVLKTRDISGERRNFRKDTPLIFVNACCTARADFSLVGIGSWADKFIKENASGFVGSTWEVNDELAYVFSKAFYEALLNGKPIGAALQEARFTIKDEPDSTWLAYTLYADPLATVEFVK